MSLGAFWPLCDWPSLLTSFGIFKSLAPCCLSFCDGRSLIIPFGVVKGFALVLSVLWLTVSVYLFWYLQTFGPCVVCPSVIDGVWLLLWYLQTVGPCVVCPSVINGLGLSLLASSNFWPCVVCPSVIDGIWLSFLVSSNCWPLCCLSFCDWRSLITSFGFFKLWFLCCLSFCNWRSLIIPFSIFKLLTFVLPVLLWLTVFDYLFWFLQAFGSCIVCPSVIEGLWLTLLVPSNFWPLCCVSFCDWRSLITTFGFFKFWLLCCLSFCYWRSLITTFGIFKLLALVLSVLLCLTVFDYTFWFLQTFDSYIVCPSVIDGLWIPLLVSSNFWLFCCLSVCDWRFLITSVGIFKPLTLVFCVLLWLTVFDYTFWFLQTFGPGVVCLVIDGLWLPLLVSSNFWPLCCLSFCDWRSSITHFGFFKLFALVLFVLPWLTVFHYPFWFLQHFGSCVVCPVIDGVWLPLLVSSNCRPSRCLSFCDRHSLITSFGIFKLLALVLSVLLWLTVFDYLFWYLQTFGPCVFCPSVIDGLWLSLLTSTNFWPCVVCPSVIDGLWLPLLVSSNCWLLCFLSSCDWRSLITPFGFFKHVALVLSVLLWLTSLITSFGFFKRLALVLSALLWLTVFDYPFWFLQTFGTCVVCPSVIDGLWLPLLVSSNFWLLCCLSFCDWRSLIISFGFFKLSALVLSGLLWLTVSGYLFWYLQTFDPCVVCPSVIDGLWLSLLVSSQFWPLCCLSFCDWRSLITTLSSRYLLEIDTIKKWRG